MTEHYVPLCLDVNFSIPNEVLRMYEEIKLFRERMPRLTFGDPADDWQIMQCIEELCPLLKDAVWLHAQSKDLPPARLQEAMKLVKTLETTLRRTQTMKPTVAESKADAKEPPVPVPPTKADEPTEMIPLCFDVDWGNIESVRKLREEISNIYNLMPSISFGDEKTNYMIRVNMKYLLPLLDKTIDRDDEEPPQARSFRDQELRRVVDLLERTMLAPFLPTQE